VRLQGIPAHLLAAAAAMPTNAGARELLEAEAAAAQPLTEPAPGRVTQRTSGELAAREKDIQREIVKLIRRRGGDVYQTSQVRAAKVTAGIPDIIAFDPYRGLVFIEVKAPDGRASEEQLTFRALCEQHGAAHIIGGIAEVRAFLRGDEKEA
jgi:hypothetical protein